MTLLAAAMVVAAALAPATAPARLFDLPDARITEASGIARGIESPDVYYVQNDSGDTARFFAVDARTGALRAVLRVPGAVNHDWEDIAVAPDADGTPSVWLADIGDNDARRNEVQVYRVDEPRIPAGAHGVSMTTTRPNVWRLRYPSGPVDAESLAVTPHGRAYVFTKNPSGPGHAYELPPAPDPRHVQLLRRINALRIPLLATGASISPDGSLLAVRTYFAVYLWRLHDGNIEAPMRAAPIEVSIPLQRQGEGVWVGDGRVVVDSEGVHTPVWSVVLPGAANPPSAPVSASAAASAATSAATSASASAAHPSPSTRPAHGKQSTRSPLLATLALIAAGCVFLAVRRLRRRG